MRLPAIALRNLASNRRRTLLSLLVIAAGTTGLLVTAGFIRFSFEGLEDALVRGGLGHLEVLTQAAAANPSTPERSGLAALADWEALRGTIERIPGVRGAGGVIHLAGVVFHGQQSSAFLGLAVEPDRERRMGFDPKLRGGADLSSERPTEGQDQVLLGSGMGRALAARPGDVVTLLVMTASGSMNAVDMKVSGVFTTGLQELDARLVKMHLASAQRLVETDRVSSIVVELADAGRIEDARAAIAHLLAGHEPRLTVLDWRARAPFYGQVRALYAGIFCFMGGVIVVLVGLSVSNTLLMSVMERVREFGTLLALGTSRGQVAALVLMEALWLGLLGAIAGDLLGLTVAAAIEAIGLEMPPPPGAVDPIPLHLALSPVDMILAGALMMAVLALASLFPLARTARLRIVDALGHV